jgi:phosphohistidine swiveling domain-containing protein
LTLAAHQSPGPVPAPPNFPVVWETPADEQIFWTNDRMHWPDPVPMLLASLDFEDGVNRAAPHYDAPIRYYARRINTYLYSAFVPTDGTPEEMEAQGKRSQEKIGAALARLDDLWANEWLPEIQSHIAYWRGFDLRGASNAALVAHLDESRERFARLTEIHFVIAFPMLLGMSQFDELYRDLFGNKTAFDAYKLLQGFPNKTVESGRALWTLSRKALVSQPVRRVLEERAADEVIGALERSSEGRAFLADLRAYLDEYGRRGDKFDVFSAPSWIERPTSVIKNLKDFVAQPDRDLDAEAVALVAERDQAIATARERLKGYPQPVVGQFEMLLKAAQTASILSEDHGFWIDYSASHEVRMLALEVGRRLVAAGGLEAPEDVVHLSWDEMRATLAALPGVDRRPLVAERKAEIERWRVVQPPPVLGTPPAGPPPIDPMNLAIMKFFGAPPQPPTEPGVLKGQAGSPGKARGVARVIRSIDDASRLRPGEVLVAETTAPPWTPLFATAAAVVSDTGGILSHCAVVAREYHIPAVVGLGMATAIIQDGQTVEVDGDAGVVRIVD